MTTGRVFVRTSARLAAIFACVAASTGIAAPLDYEVSLGAGHSDNIGRTEVNEDGEGIAAAGLRFSLDRQSERLQAEAVGNLSYVDYLDNTYDSEVLGNFAGNARFALVPERFEWMAADNFGQALTDPFAPATPDNRENINYFSTGPDMTMAFGSQTRVRLGGRYALTTYEDRPLDSDTVSGQLALIRRLSAASSISLNGQHSEVSYDTAALNADYQQRDVFLRYDITGARTYLAVEAGYSEVEQEIAADSEGGLLLRLDASRRVSPSSLVTLRAGREFANSGSAFAATQNSGIVGQQPVEGLQTAQPFTNDYLGLGWQFARNRSSFTLAATRNKQSYENASTFDQTLTSVSGQFGRNLSPQLSAALLGLYSRGDFRLPSSDYKDVTAGVSLSWRLSRTLSLSASYNYFDRSTATAGGEYTENRFWLLLAFGRGTPRDMLARPDFAGDGGI